MRKILPFSKRKLPLLLAALICACCLIVSGCSRYTPHTNAAATVNLTVASGREYTCAQNVFQVERGDDVIVELKFFPGYAFDTCDYKKYYAEYKDENTVVITLYNVRYPTFVSVSARAVAEGIYYHSNGGTFLDGNGEYVIEWANAAEGRRQNTNIGDRLQRHGYTLTAWNTEADGTGERVGLGSRITLLPDTIIDLYAQWSEWLPPETFGYEESEKGLILTSFTGNLTEPQFTVPSYVSGKPVIGIASGFVSNLITDTIVLPNTLRCVEKRAFENCKTESVCFFDNLEYVVDESFSGTSIKTLRINACVAPRYLGYSEVSEFADRMDRLIVNRNKKKLVFFAGCSMGYGLNSSRVSEAFNGEYEVINFGTMGETHAGAQMDCIAKFLRDGDVFIHAPEPAAPYQLMFTDTMESNIFLLCEGNFDLISYIDVSGYKDVLTAFCIFNTVRLGVAGGSYSDDTHMHNQYGDVITERMYTGKNVSYNDYEYTYVLDYVTQTSIDRLCNSYDKIASTGARVAFSFAPVNFHGLTEEAVRQKVWLSFERAYTTGLSNRGYAVISLAEDYLMEGRYFWDTDYHLNDVGVEIRTERLISDIKTYIGGERG